MNIKDIKDKKAQKQAKEVLDMFRDFNIEMDLVDVIDGYRTLHIQMRPKKRIRMKSLHAFSDDLGYALGIEKNRINVNAPVTGKSFIEVEIFKNAKLESYTWKGAMKSKESNKVKDSLTIPIGSNDYREEMFANLEELPHLLIAGATGSGKSVAIHSIINSLIANKTPEQLKLLLIDPKRAELTLYNKLPHLITPVIVDPKKAVLALKWASEEMERRYDILEEKSCRDIKAYHEKIYKPALKKGKRVFEAMPYIVITIDELADIMAMYPLETEAGIVRLAQMSRAVGIHLIVATQRPSINVLTGIIKANIPARIALQVASQIDSRTILDLVGAEKLLGAGDALFLPGDVAYPSRVQIPFISESEVKKNIKDVIKKFGVSMSSIPTDEKVILSENSFSEADYGDEDELYASVRSEVIRQQKASTAYIQRKFKIGYARAARLMDMLEERGVVGPQNGSTPREILVEE